MYQKLLLNCEGGVIDAAQQYEQDNCAVVAVGLGGTGIDCLKNLKAKIYNRVKADNPGSAVPVYSHIKFLAVDTDKTGLETSNNRSYEISRINMDTEFFDISYTGDITALLKDNARSLAAKPEYKEWLKYEDIKVLSAKAGAGGVRQLGRYLMMEKSQAFTTKIRSLVSQTKSGLDTPKVYVHIFSGLCGGTGAGAFLDVCYLVREALRLEGADAFVCGYFFLPDVNLAVNLDKETAAYVQVNGYAAMRELDYCTNFEGNGDKWSQRYTGVGLVESKYPPVDICHLVSAKDASGDVIPNAYNYSMNVVTDYFMDFLVKTDETFTLNSHIANFTQRKSKVNKEHGAQYEYCVLGASNATLPFKEVLTYLAARMFASFESVKRAVPAKSQFDDFVARNGLLYNPLFAQLVQGCDMTFPYPDVKWQDAKGADSLTSSYFDDHRARVENALDKNFSALARPLESYSPVAEGGAGAPRSAISRIYAALRALMIDPEKGPFFAAAILRSAAGSDLIALIDGHIAEARLKYQHESVNEDRVSASREQAQRDFIDNSNVLNGKKKYEKYCSMTRQLAVLRTRMAVFSRMVDFLEILRKQLESLAGNFMDVFSEVMNQLIDTFAANRDYLDHIADDVATYEMPLARISDLKESLDQTIKTMNMHDKTRDFMIMMLSEDSIKAWITLNDNETTSNVSRYFTRLFNDFSRKTMTSYLQDKYCTTDPARLVRLIREDIMNKLENSATPMFWASALNPIDNASKLGYISVPSTCEEVVLAAESLREANSELTVRRTDIRDRISIMRCLVGAPMYGYQGLLQYEKNSVSDPAVGKHLYEGRTYMRDDGEMAHGRDWNELPSPSPLSLMTGHNSLALKKAGETAASLYKKAEEAGTIVQTGLNEYGARLICRSFMLRAKEVFEGAAAKANEDKIEAQGKLAVMRSNLEYEIETVRIENDASPSLPEINKRLVRIDHFAASPRLQEIARAELEKLDIIEKWLQALEPSVDTDLNNFLMGLFTGVIVFRAPQVEFENEFGEKTALSSPDMKRGGVPLYQAYLSYLDIDAEIGEAILENTEKVQKTSPLPAGAIEACKAVNEELCAKNLKYMMEEANAVFPKEVKNVREFLKAARENLDRFTRRYRISLGEQ
ncbi:MAG: tubulin-like doman-containing protein [Clostridiales bacterium]|nr:tubulin-like doman-containing protein [Clostridiales bacterium]